MCACCYPRLPTLNDPHYQPDLEVNFNDNFITLSVHRDYLCAVSKYFRENIESQLPNHDTGGRLAVEISDFGLAVIKSHYHSANLLTQFSTPILYTNALKWEERRLLDECLAYLEQYGVDNFRLSYPQEVREHFNANVSIRIDTVKRLLPLVDKNNPDALSRRIVDFMLNQIGGPFMHKLWQWAHELRLDHLTESIVEFAQEVTWNLPEDELDDYNQDYNLFHIASLWIYMGEKEKFDRVDDFLFHLEHFRLKEEAHHWVKSSSFTARLAFKMYDLLEDVPLVGDLVRKKIQATARKFTSPINSIKPNTIKLYMKFLVKQLDDYTTDETRWLGPVANMLGKFIHQRYHWPNGTKETYRELDDILESVKCKCQPVIVRQTFLDNAICVIEEKLHKVDSAYKRRTFYRYMNRFSSFGPEMMIDKMVNFDSLPLLILLELYEYASEHAYYWLSKVGLDNALLGRSHCDKVKIDSAEFKALIRLVNDQSMMYFDYKRVAQFVHLTEDTVYKFHAEFGHVPELAKLSKEFIFSQLNSGCVNSKAVRFFNTLSALDYEPFKKVMIKWVKSTHQETDHLNFELKLRIARHYQLSPLILYRIEKRLVKYLLNVPPACHRAVWRQWFHSIFALAARKQCLLLQQNMVQWLSEHLGESCHPSCEVIVGPYDYPYFYKISIDALPSNDLVKTEVCSQLPSQPSEWYEEFVGIDRGDLRETIESSLIGLAETCSVATAKQLWEIANANHRFDECPSLKAILEQRLDSNRQSNQPSQAKRIKVK